MVHLFQTRLLQQAPKVINFYKFCVCSTWGLFLCNRLSSRNVYIFVSARLILSKLTARSQFPELLFAAASDYQNQGGNPIHFAGIREPVWSYLRDHRSLFQVRDCNASFSQIFREKTFGKLNPDEVSLFATQRLFESYCPTYNKNVNLNSNIFLTCVS